MCEKYYSLVWYVLKTFTPSGKHQETYLIFLNFRLASSTAFARPFKQVPFLAINATTMESYLFIVIVLSIKHLKSNLVCFFFLVGGGGYLLKMYACHLHDAFS